MAAPTLKRILICYRLWQSALASNPGGDECRNYLHQLYRDLRLAPGFDAPELEKLHLEAFPDPAARPTRLVPTDLVFEDILE